MKLTNTHLGLMVLAVIGMLGISFFIFSNDGTTPTGQAIGDTEEPLHLFEGVIDNVDVEPGIIEGEGVYDRNCIPVNPNDPHGKVSCDAGIDTDEYGVLNFHYEHNMAEEPCIAPGEPVEVEILDDTGAAEVSRFEAWW